MASAGRAGEAGEPGEPLVAGRHVFVLVAVGARHDEAVEAAPLEFGAQRRDAAARWRRGSLRSSNDWKWASNMRGNLWSRVARRRAMARTRRRARVDSTSVVQPSSVDAPLERKRRDRRRAPHWPARQEAGQDDAAAGREQASAAARRGACSGPSRILAKTRSNGARGTDRCARSTPSACTTSTSAPARLSRALSRAARTARASMSVASTRRRSARAAAIASTPVPVPRSRMRRVRFLRGRSRALHDRSESIERQQAAARGAVMAGAEGERRLDLDADPAWRDAGAIVRAVHDEAAGRDRLQAREALAHPILGGDALEAQRLAGLCAGRRPPPERAPRSRQADRESGSMTRQRPRPLSTRLTAASSSAQEPRQTGRRMFWRPIVHRFRALAVAV